MTPEIIDGIRKSVPVLAEELQHLSAAATTETSLTDASKFHGLLAQLAATANEDFADAAVQAVQEDHTTDTVAAPSDVSFDRSAGLCAQADPEIFYPEKGGSAKAAKQTCARCDIKDTRLEEALHTNQEYGIWGGLNERERRKLKKQNKVTIARGSNE